MIKNKKRYKVATFLTKLGIIFVLILNGAGCSKTDTKPNATPSEPSKPQIEVVDVIRLPSITEAEERLEKIFGGTDKIYISANGIARRAYYKDAPTKVNICFQPTFTQKLILEDVIEEYNEIFKVVNPNYQFVLNYSPTKDDIENDKYAIDVYISDELDSSKGGQTENSLEDIDKGFSLFEYVNSSILINSTFANDGRKFANVFRHEFMHTFGCGDAYLNENATKETIMQSVSTAMVGLYEKDVSFLDALYRSPTNSMTDDEIQDFIDHYDDHDEKYGLKNTILKIYREKFKEFDLNTLKASIQNSPYLPADINNVLSALGNTLTFEPINNIFAFEELKHSEMKDEEYSYFKTPYIKDEEFELEFGEYAVSNHGDALFTEPDSNDKFYFDEQILCYGNIKDKLFIRVNDYVLSFDTNYTFTNSNSKIKLTFSKLYKPTTQSVFDYSKQIRSWLQEEQNQIENSAQ